MKKVILSAAAILAANTALAAEAPKDRIEGRVDFQAAVVHQKKEFRNSNPSNPAPGVKLSNGGFANDTKFDLHVDGKMKEGVTYGGMIRFHADTSPATNKETTFADKVMVYFQNDKFGRIEAGSTPGAGGLFEMDTVNLAKGSWGVEGFASQWLTDQTKRTNAIFLTALPFSPPNDTLAGALGGMQSTRSIEMIMSPNLPSNYSGHYYSDAPKINFFTKPLNELTIGVSYIPDMDSTGTVTGMAPKNAGPVFDASRSKNPATFRNVISGGFVYEKSFNKDYGIKTGVAGEIGKAKLAYVNDLKAFEAGLMVRYKDFKIGGTYGSWFDSLTLKDKIAGARHGSKYFTIGASQDIDKFGTSVTYLNSKKAGGIEILGKQIKDSAVGPFVALSQFADTKYNKFNHIALDMDYKLAPGFLPYVTLSAFEFKESTGAKDNGYVAMVGTRLLF
jgi:hypothetical protein